MREAVILAGGLGTRLRKVVPDVPKPMAPVAGRPFLEILLEVLARKGFTRVVLSLGFMAEKIIEHFGASYLGVELLYEVEAQPLGTGGAIRAALARCIADPVFIFNGDTYLDIEADDLDHLWRTNNHPVIVVRKVPGTLRFGRVDMRDGRIHGFRGSGIPGPGLINAGCYVFPKNILDNYTLGQPFSLEADFFGQYMQRMWFDGFVTDGRFIDIGVPDDYLLAQTEFAGL